MRFLTVGLKRTVSLVLLPVDDFTGQVITGSQLRMYTEEGGKPSIRKTDGYHVFCDLSGTSVRICIEGPLYQKQTVELPIDKKLTVHQVWMLPNSSYPIPSGATCIRGKLHPGSRFWLYFPEAKKNYKLLYDYEPEKHAKSLELFCPDQVHLEGKTLCIRSQKDEGEFFRVTGQKDEVCQLEEPLKKSYKKIGTSVYPVYEVYAGADGDFYLPIRSLPADRISGICLIADREGTEEIRRSLVLEAGRENRITENIYLAHQEEKA